MPFVENEGAQIYWTAIGTGPPVLLIMGLSFTHEMWSRLLPHLSDYKAILFDNRGMGRSSVPHGRYSIRQMARDAAAVLDAAGEQSAHVIGASMGGMIAQELALRSPNRVRSLCLGCTSHSGVIGRWPRLRDLPFNAAGADRSAREQAFVPLLYATATPLERIEEDLRIRCACGWDQNGFVRQFGAVLLWTAYRRLPRIKIPTLVVHGAEDRLIPPANGRVLARRIPGARFVLIEKAGHVLTTDQPDGAADLLLTFLRTQSPSRNEAEP